MLLNIIICNKNKCKTIEVKNNDKIEIILINVICHLRLPLNNICLFNINNNLNSDLCYKILLCKYLSSNKFQMLAKR